MDFEKTFKKIFKELKINEQTISTILGAVVILIVGILIFNYFKSTADQTNQLEEIKLEEIEDLDWATEEEKAILEDLPETYKVEASDTLWKISEKFYQSGYNWVDIATANDLSNPDLIEVGMELKLPKTSIKKPATEEVVVKISDKEPAEDAITGDKYTVKKGDSLWKIAVRAYNDGYKWPEISQTNNLANPNYLEVDQELTLPR